MTGGFGNKRTSGDHPTYYITENGQNTKKCPENLKKTSCHSNSSETSSANADGENSQGVNNGKKCT